MPAKILSECDPRVQQWIGKTVGRITLLGFHSFKSYPNGERRQMWNCLCDCGVEFISDLSGVRTGHTSSCGCTRAEGVRKACVTHGLSCNYQIHPVYQSWHGMKQRCENPNNADYAIYGGRGITICERWKTPEMFVADMLDSWKPGLSIERKDNDKGYSPENCKWGTKREQSLNRRTARLITYQGLTLNSTLWAEKTGMTRKTITNRLDRGWSVEKVFSTPVKQR